RRRLSQSSLTRRVHASRRSRTAAWSSGSWMPPRRTGSATPPGWRIGSPGEPLSLTRAVDDASRLDVIESRKVLLEVRVATSRDLRLIRPFPVAGIDVVHGAHAARNAADRRESHRVES